MSLKGSSAKGHLAVLDIHYQGLEKGRKVTSADNSNDWKKLMGLGESKWLAEAPCWSCLGYKEKICLSDLKHLLGTEPEKALVIAIPCFICCPVFAGACTAFTAHPI